LAERYFDNDAEHYHDTTHSTAQNFLKSCNLVSKEGCNNVLRSLFETIFPAVSDGRKHSYLEMQGLLSLMLRLCQYPTLIFIADLDAARTL